MAKKLTDKEARDFIEEHLPYEVHMLRAAIMLLATGCWARPMRNMLIEDFCLHARNLAEFFKNKDDCDFEPRMFAKDGYKLNTKFVDGSRLSRINEQISHLSKRRTRLNREKIDHGERAGVLSAIEDELNRLKAELKPPYDKLWKVGPGPSQYILVGPTPGATGVIDTLSSTTATFATPWSWSTHTKLKK
jgi:hypothetical protein